jgi:hypothetical protein
MSSKLLAFASPSVIQAPYSFMSYLAVFANASFQAKGTNEKYKSFILSYQFSVISQAAQGLIV